MIGLSRLKRAMADVPTGGMQTGYSKVPLKLCDAQRLEVEFNAIIVERDAALAQNAELVAELDSLAAFRDEVVGVMNNSQGVSGWHHNQAIATWDELFPTVPDFESPTQFLRDVKAEAGRAGFVAGYMLCNDGSPLIAHNYQGFADNYAESIKAGNHEKV